MKGEVPERPEYLTSKAKDLPKGTLVWSASRSRDVLGITEGDALWKKEDMPSNVVALRYPVRVVATNPVIQDRQLWSVGEKMYWVVDPEQLFDSEEDLKYLLPIDIAKLRMEGIL